MKKLEKSREEIDAEIYKDLRTLQKEMKKLSKNQLIKLVLNQMQIAMEQQNINQVLLEKLKETENSNEINS